MKKVAIIQFPGSNCEAESAAAIRRNGMHPKEFLWNRSSAELSSYDGYFLVGGFSYEDRSRAGVLASLDPILEIIKREAETGKPVLGICNGAQILVESGLVPGVSGNKVAMSLAPNRRQVGEHLLGSGFFNDWCFVKSAVDPDRTAFTRHIEKGDQLNIPFAHAEGRFLAHPSLLEEIMERGQGVFQYSAESGNIENHFPTNPNGSAENLAAVSNPAGNVMAMMPHPERTPNGNAIFSSMREYMERGQTHDSRPLEFHVENEQVEERSVSAGSVTLPVSLIITDTTAKSVEQSLRRIGFDVSVERRILWELEHSDFPENWETELKETGELFNSNKEFVDRSDPGDPSKVAVVCVSPTDDLRGKRVLETLQRRFHLEYPSQLNSSVLWILRFQSAELRKTQLPKVLSTHILHNPVSDTIGELDPEAFLKKV
ncbi:MAG: phosphoribosylformylglycinamidine synthase I [Verrucomicrobiota bacterium]